MLVSEYVLSLRRLVSVNLLIAAVAVSTGTRSIATQLQHPMCASQHHQCGQETKIRPCCCDERENTSQSGPVESRVRVTADLSLSAPADLSCASVIGRHGAMVRVQTSPPNLHLLDFQTLFACLLL